MGSYWTSVETDQDLDDISEYTELNWGKSQALEYINSLIQCFEKLAGSPKLGQEVSELYPRLRKYNYKAHSVFYISYGDDIMIVRVLGKMQDFYRHLDPG